MKNQKKIYSENIQKEHPSNQMTNKQTTSIQEPKKLQNIEKQTDFRRFEMHFPLKCKRSFLQ